MGGAGTGRAALTTDPAPRGRGRQGAGGEAPGEVRGIARRTAHGMAHVMARVPSPSLGALGGLLLALGLPPFAMAPLAVLGVGAFVLALDRASSSRGAATAGALFGGVTSVLALHWIPAAAEPWLGVGGGILAGISVWLLHAAGGAVAAAMAHALREDLPLALRAGAAMGLLEWLPGALPVVGIPWFTMAASLDGWSLLLPLLAVVGSGGVAVLVAAGWGAGLAARHSPRVAGITALLLAGWVAGAFLLPPAPTAAPGAGPGGGASPTPEGAPSPGSGAPVVALLSWERTRAELSDGEALRAGVQHLVDQAVPWDADADSDAGVRALWPEAPLPTLPGDDPLAMAWLQAVQRSGEPLGAVAGTHALVGGHRYNTLVLTGARDEAPEGVHRKRFLVPGVERTTLFSPGREGSGERGGGGGRGLAPGAGALPFDWSGVRAGPLICFEILHPVEAARLRRRGAQLLVQSTNDAMLQSGGALPVVADAARKQHEAMGRIRAAEFRVPLVRSALGGRAFAADPRGREIPPHAVHPLARGNWQVVTLPPAPPPPPAAWLVPLTGPLLLGLLGIPLVFRWRRGQVLGGMRSGGAGGRTRR